MMYAKLLLVLVICAASAALADAEAHPLQKE